MPALMYSLAALMIIVGSLDFSLFVFKNPASMAVGIAGLAVWWTVGITIAVKAVLKTRPAPKQPQAPHETAGYAGFWRRAAASVIDTVILVISGAILGGLLGGIVGAYLGANGADVPAIENIARVIGFIQGLVLNWLYFTLFESSSRQATPGKAAIGIQVTDLNGYGPSFARANGRYWGKIVSSIPLGIGFIMAGVTQKKQALHDKMAGTFVIRR